MSGYHLIADLPEDDRPRERLVKLGAQALSSAELIAILLRVGVQGEGAVQVGQRLLKQFGGLSGLTPRPHRRVGCPAWDWGGKSRADQSRN
jgi:DNA repair protein RadC